MNETILAAAAVSATILPPPSESQLTARFLAEFTEVSGKLLCRGSFDSLMPTLMGLARSASARKLAFAAGAGLPLSKVAQQLAQEGFEVSQAGEGAEQNSTEAMGAWEIGVVEADYAIAATGTLALVASPQNPRVLSLLPPISVVALRASRIVPNLAAMFGRLDPAVIAHQSIVLVTGPSRTADIEKRLVLGAHGPKELYLALIEDSDAAI